MDQNVNVAKKSRSSSGKKDGAKVHRKIHKAEREKLKRDHMNELFIALGKALEPANLNNGKSCTLTDTIRILRDLVAQVDSLKKENSSLFAESQYIAVEKNELKEENSAIEAQIKKLQNQIHQSVHPPSLWRPATLPPVPDTVFVVPLQNDPKPVDSETVMKRVGPNVSKPHARYPSPSDSWPFNILSGEPRAD